MKEIKAIFLKDTRRNVFIFWNTSRHDQVRNLRFVFLGKKKMNYFIKILKVVS